MNINQSINQSINDTDKRRPAVLYVCFLRQNTHLPSKFTLNSAFQIGLQFWLVLLCNYICEVWTYIQQQNLHQQLSTD